MIEIAPGIRRIKPITTRARKTPFDTEKRIVKDYYLNGFTAKEIGDKYDKKTWQVEKILESWKNCNKPLEFKQPPEAIPPEISEQVFLIECKDIEFLSFLLTEWGVKYRIPEHVELTEYHQSKINEQRI